jgi:hydrophobic/amphiphilic exporter-1 (mainly G- bacteria), HAE1 family
MSIARFAVSRRVAVTMIAAAIIVLGLFAVPRLPVALLPSFSPPVITVSVDYPNVGPAQMETLVTRPIENAVSRVNGIDIIDSTSAQGLSEVRATFHYGVNIDTASVDVQQQVNRVRGQLPNDPTLGQPQIFKFDANSLPIVRAYVNDPTMTVRDLGDLFTNQLADEFSSVSGVASVGVSVDQQRAIMIQPDANLLAGYGLTMNQIVTRLQQENVTLPAGIVQVGQNEYQLRTSALYQTSDQVAGTLITTKNGAPVFLRDIASVQDAITEQRTFQRLNGTPAIGVTINAQPDANVVATASGVYAKIHDMERRYPGMHFGIVLDQQGFIQQAVNALEHTAMYGALLAVLVILLFLHSWRSTLIVAISLPISVLGTLFVAYLLGYTLNVMTLGGLALAVGLIVDDAIVVIENIARHRVHEPNPSAAAESAVNEIFSAVLASSITVITVFVPLILIPGLQGLLFTSFAIMVMVAVALSLLVALTTVPMLSTVLYRQGPKTNGDAGEGRYARFVRGFDRRYDQFAGWYKHRLTWAVDHPIPVFAVAGLILAITLLALQFGVVKTEIFPASNSRYVRFNFRMPNGTALNVTNAVIQDIEGRIMKDPRTLDVGVQVGSEARTNYANLFATLKPSVSGAEAAQFVKQWQRALTTGGGGRGGAPSAQAGKSGGRFGPPITGLIASGRTTDIVSNIISRGQDALDIQLYGPDVTTLLNIAHQQVIPQLAQLSGISRPDTNITDSQPELDVVVDRTKAASLGLSTQAISQTIATATSGTIPTYLQINGTQYPIEIQLPPGQRRSISSIAALPIPASTVPTSGLQINSSPAPGSIGLPTVPLGEVAQISIGQGPSQITRENKQREIDVSATLLGTPLGSVVGEATRVMSGVALPAGYHWQFGQAVTAQGSTFSSLGLIVMLAIVLIYMLLASQFESLLHPLVIMVAVPLSIAGVVLALVVTQRSFGLTAFIGLLMLVGIVVKNAILVVQFTNELRARGLSARDAVLQAAPLRLRPILMTTLATIGGMLPITIGIEEGSQTQSPLGTVVIGGLIVSTMLSLIVVPTLYIWVATHIEPRFGGFRRMRDGRAVSVSDEGRTPQPAPIRRQ